MAKCKNCKDCKFEVDCILSDSEREKLKICLIFEEKTPITNAMRIRNMTDEEIANFITNIRTKWIDEYEYVYVIKGKQLSEFEDVLEWLKSEVGCE